MDKDPTHGASKKEDANYVEFNLLDRAFMEHPQPVYQKMRKKCPVARTDGFSGVVLFSHDAVQYALKHPEIFSSRMENAFLGNKHPLIPLQVDPPQHVKYRKILDPLFSHKKMVQLEPEFAKLANQLIDAFIDEGECEFNSAFAIPFPCTVFLGLMGLPLEELELFLEMKNGIIRPNTSDPDEATRMRTETGERIYAYFEKAIEDRIKKPGEDLLSYFIEAEVNGERLTRSEIHGICFLFLLGGLDTVTATLGCGMTYLAQHPEQRRKLVEDPEIIPSAVEEILRWETPVTGIARILEQDATLGGVELSKGEHVTVLLGSANTDENAFPNANQVDFERRPNPHLAFGGGPHRCLGSHLARAELGVAFREIHRRIPEYRIKPGEKPSYAIAIREVQYLPLVFGAGSQDAS